MKKELNNEQRDILESLYIDFYYDHLFGPENKSSREMQMARKKLLKLKDYNIEDLLEKALSRV